MCQRRFGALNQLQLDLINAGITDVKIVGVSMIQFADQDKSATLNGRILPLVQDTPAVNVGGTWNALQRDLFILDEEGRLASKINLTTLDPDKTASQANYDLVRGLMLNARNRTDLSVSGNMLFQLFQDLAPQTVARVTELVNSGLYDGLTFHNVFNDLFVQGGDPAGNGTGGSGLQFADEFNSKLTFTGQGQLAMANFGDDTNDSQFFITDLDLGFGQFVAGTKLPPQQRNFDNTIFGQLIEGFDLLQKIMQTETNANGQPLAPVVINDAAIVSDKQNAVLRVSAPPGFTGSSTITVTVANSLNLSSQRTFQVDVVADPVNDRPFLGTINNVVTGSSTPAVINLSATDSENDALTFVVRDPNNFSNPPPNLTVSIDQATRQVTLTPAAGFTGLINLLVGVRDSTRRVDTNGDEQITAADDIEARENYDTQRVALSVIAAGSNLEPVLSGPTAIGVTIDRPIEFVVSVTDAESDPATFLAGLVFQRANQPAALNLHSDEHLLGGITASATLIEYLDFQ